MIQHYNGKYNSHGYIAKTDKATITTVMPDFNANSREQLENGGHEGKD